MRKLSLAFYALVACSMTVAFAQNRAGFDQYGAAYRICRDSGTAAGCESLAIRFNSLRDAGLIKNRLHNKRVSADLLASRFDTIRCIGDSTLSGGGFYCAENGNLYETFRACSSFCERSNPAAALFGKQPVAPPGAAASR